jgi:hypothetical protein
LLARVAALLFLVALALPAARCDWEEEEEGKFFPDNTITFAASDTSADEKSLEQREAFGCSCGQPACPCESLSNHQLAEHLYPPVTSNHALQYQAVDSRPMTAYIPVRAALMKLPTPMQSLSSI